MTRLATALLLLAGGLTATTPGPHPDGPTGAKSDATSGRHRQEAARPSRSMRRLPLPQLVGPVTQPGRKARSRRAHGSPARSHVLLTGARQPHHNWAAVAACESGGRWDLNTGNGYFGGLQFSLSTWRSLGGVGLPSEASRGEQIHRAELLYARSGSAPWPVCGGAL